MSRLIIARAAQLPLILLAIYTITLALAWAIPGNPLENPEGRRPPPEVTEQLERQYNLDSFPAFYVTYLDRATGVRWLRSKIRNGDEPAYVFDLGPSLQYTDWNVNEIIGAALPESIKLGGTAIIIAVVCGVLIGVIGAVRPGSALDASTFLIALVGVSVPSFVTGTVLLLLFGVLIPIVPVAEWGSLRALLLPAAALSLPFMAYIARLTRLGMIEALGSDYVRTARAKGLSETDVVFKHALRNALLPVVSYIGPATAYAMTGSFVIERVFRVPGLGQHFVNAVQNKDLFLIIGVTLVFSSMLVVFNLAVDVVYRWVDPRTNA